MIRITMFIAVALLAAAFYFSDTLARGYLFLTLDDQSRLQQRLSSFHQIFTSREVPALQPKVNEVGGKLVLPEMFSTANEQLNTADYLADTHTDGLMVLVDGKQVLEQYYGEFSASSQHISWSLSKSIVSLLFGQAEAKGLVSRQQVVSYWLPELSGVAYGDVTLEQLLKMSSGIHFDENYAEPSSDINRLGKTVVLEGSIIKFLQGFDASPTREQGEYLYVSTDTQVLAMALVRATDKSITELTNEWLWQPLNMQQPGYWLVDRDGFELGFGGFNATLADYARLVDMVGNQGRWQDQEIVPLQYVEALRTDTAQDPNKALLPGWRYGLHWWLPDEQSVLGIGVYNQFLYTRNHICANGNAHRVTIAKLSSDGAYAVEQEVDFALHVALFKAIAQQACLLPNGEPAS